MLRPLEVKTFERLNQHVGVSEEFIALVNSPSYLKALFCYCCCFFTGSSVDVQDRFSPVPTCPSIVREPWN